MHRERLGYQWTQSLESRKKELTSLFLYDSYELSEYE